MVNIYRAYAYERKREGKSIFPLVLIGMLAGFLLSAVCTKEAGKHGIKILDYLDYVAYLFGGMKSYIPDPQSPFLFPTAYLILHLPCFFLRGYYWQEYLLEGFYPQIVKRAARKIFLGSVLLWNAVTILFYYAGVLAGGAIFCCYRKNTFSGKITETFHREVGGIQWKKTDIRNILFCLCLIFMYLLLLHSLQTILVLWKGGLAGCLITALYLFVSTYITSPWLFGNYTMLYRYNLVQEETLRWKSGLLLWLEGSILLLFGTKKFLEKIDFLTKEDQF